MDVVSAMLSVLAIVPIVYAVKSFAHNGLTVIAVAALLAGLGAGGVFLRRQRTLATPLIDVDLFKRPAFTWAIIATVLAIFSLAGLLYFFSQYLQLVRGYSTLQAGLTELPTSLASIAVVVVVASVVRRLGNGRALGGGLILAAVGLLVVAVGESYGGIIVICVGLLIIGAGIGLAFTVSTGAVLGSCRRTGPEPPPPSQRPALSSVSPWESPCWERPRTSATGSCSGLPSRVFRVGWSTPLSSRWQPCLASSIRLTPHRPS